METKTVTMNLKISFSGIVSRINRGKTSKQDKLLLQEVCRLFNETREEYLKGNKEIADQFFQMVV
jgi:hypothetical protein